MAKSQSLSPAAVLEALRHHMPIAPTEVDISRGCTGLVLVDPVVGFTTRGPLSDEASMQPMVTVIDDLCRSLLATLGERLSVFVFRDHHGADQLEPPYPPHCQEGTGEEELDPKLAWLHDEPRAVIFDKDCINGVIGAFEPVQAPGSTVSCYANRLVDWMVEKQLDRVVVVGDCTDICVMDFVVALLSVRNHGMLSPAQSHLPVLVYTPACATYHLPDPAAVGLPETARHDRDITHHAALYFMHSRGAVLVDQLRT